MRDVCGDCGRTNPTWASLNKGVLLCQECCSIHRSMGRHISWVRSLQQGWWSPTLLMMVEALSKAGANSVWEHSLMDKTAGMTCKPSSTETTPTTKEDLIRSKHEELAYILRGEAEADGCEGVGAQLHAAARTNDLLTSLRLFSQGADPNYYHEEKGSCPLHVAAKANQALQAELLMVYGADLNKRDAAGRTPEDVARDSGHVALAERLRTARYHVFDRLIQFLCSRRSGAGQCGGIEDICLEITDNIEGRSRLQALVNSQFEKLVSDVYDEVDRREAGAAWQGGPGAGGVDPAPFLPPHPELSATRNQGRQKLGRLSAPALDQLLRDVIREARRRDLSLTQGKLSFAHQSSPLAIRKLKPDISDDEPLYDSVASDDDYASTNSGEQMLPFGQSQTAEIKTLQSLSTAFSSIQPQSSVVGQSQPSSINYTEVLTLKNSLLSSEANVARLQSEIRSLHDQVAVLMKENRELREEMTKSRTNPRNADSPRTPDEQSSLFGSRNLRPTSMYEARDRPRNWSSVRGASSPLQSVTHWPDYSAVIGRTEHVTKCIQELCAGMKMLDYDALSPAAARIRTAVTKLTSLFSHVPSDEIIRELTASARQLELECACASSCLTPAHDASLQKIRDIAYAIAKATKQLVVRAQAQQQSPA